LSDDRADSRQQTEAEQSFLFQSPEREPLVTFDPTTLPAGRPSTLRRHTQPEALVIAPALRVDGMTGRVTESYKEPFPVVVTDRGMQKQLIVVAYEKRLLSENVLIYIIGFMHTLLDVHEQHERHPARSPHTMFDFLMVAS